jgi:ABC-type Fe3+/spermidine/putrescine transport system ATPase subunit
VLRGGRIQDLGAPHRVYLRPNGIFVANLIGGANLLEGIVDTVTQESSMARMRGNLMIRAPGSLVLTTQEPVILAIRKESVEISTQDLRRDNVLKSEIREVRFLGSSREYVLRLTNGDVIASRRFIEAVEPDYKVSDHVSVGFDQSDIVVFAYPPQGLRKELEIS